MRYSVLFSSLVAFVLTALLTGISPAFAANDTVQVTVNVSTVSEITVLPTSISWTGASAITPGTDSSTTTIYIKNTGSINVSSIYLNASTLIEESANPLSASTAAAYSSAGFVLVKNSTDTPLYHAGRLEWNLSSVLAGETLNSLSGITRFAHGWYKNTSGGENDYLWQINNGSGSGFCNTSTAFVIKNLPENSSMINRDLTSETTSCNLGSSNTNWGTYPCTAGPLNGHCVAVAADCTKAYIYRYNYASDFPACTARKYLYESNVIPGDERTISVLASVPKGTPAGTAQVGTLTIIAS